MKIWSILGKVNAGVNSDIAGSNGQTISTQSPIIEKYNLDLWLVFLLGFLAGLFVYWIFSSIKIIRYRKKEENDKNNPETKDPPIQRNNESE